MDQLINLKSLVASLVYSLVGFVVFLSGFYIFDKLTPYHLWKELTEKNNVALAIVVGSVSIGISLIIASAIHG
jgi:uncharacterized membrane protein YjfL (UPF0719 family)